MPSWRGGGLRASGGRAAPVAGRVATSAPLGQRAGPNSKSFFLRQGAHGQSGPHRGNCHVDDFPLFFLVYKLPAISCHHEVWRWLRCSAPSAALRPLPRPAGCRLGRARPMGEPCPNGCGATLLRPSDAGGSAARACDSCMLLEPVIRITSSCSACDVHFCVNCVNAHHGEGPTTQKPFDFARPT